MNDMERLEKFIQRRAKWKKYELKPQQTDLQHLREQEHNMWYAMITFILLLSRCNFGDGHSILHPLFWIATVSGWGFIIYLGVEATRAAKLREIFERTAIQSATDVIADIKKRAAAPSQQGEAAS